MLALFHNKKLCEKYHYIGTDRGYTSGNRDKPASNRVTTGRHRGTALILRGDTMILVYDPW